MGPERSGFSTQVGGSFQDTIGPSYSDGMEKDSIFGSSEQDRNNTTTEKGYRYWKRVKLNFWIKVESIVVLIFLCEQRRRHQVKQFYENKLSRQAWGAKNHALHLKRVTSPSAKMYSFPSSLSLPASLAACIEPASISSS